MGKEARKEREAVPGCVSRGGAKSCGASVSGGLTSYRQRCLGAPSDGCHLQILHIVGASLGLVR